MYFYIDNYTSMYYHTFILRYTRCYFSIAHPTGGTQLVAHGRGGEKKKRLLF